jgi:hypothetical protein
VAVNVYKVRDAKDAGGELFRQVQRQKPEFQGTWVVSPEGKVLAAHRLPRAVDNWANELLDALDAGLKAFGPVEERKIQRAEPLPYRGIGVPPDGRVTLALCTRHLREGKRDGPPVLDTLTLSPEDWSAFTPRQATPGTEWAVPPGVARQLCRCMSPFSDHVTMPRPDDVTTIHLAGRVTDVADGVAQIRYTGEIATRHVWYLYENKPLFAQARITGVARYDVKARRLLSLLLVLEGTHRGVPPYDAPRPSGAVADWTAK